MQVKISVVIITFNEEKNIGRCLESIQGIADEIIVVDSYSTDKTKKICLQFGAKFLENPFKGHIEQKNWAKEQASFQHILSLDADEALSEELKRSILTAKSNWKKDVYQLNRLTNYCGKWIHHTNWYPDTKTRLFDKGKGNWGGNNPHDKFIPLKTASFGFLEGDLLHYSFYTRREHILQIQKFSSIGANALFNKGKKSSLLKIFIKPIAKFIKNYLLFKGFLDGKEGFTISRLSAYANYLKYLKLYRLQNGESI